jgi:hypothetical protein
MAGLAQQRVGAGTTEARLAKIIHMASPCGVPQDVVIQSWKKVSPIFKFPLQTGEEPGKGAANIGKHTKPPRKCVN